MHVSLPSRRSLSHHPPCPHTAATLRRHATLPARSFTVSLIVSLCAGLLGSVLVSCFFPAAARAQLAPQRQWAVFRQTDGLLSNDVYSILSDDGAIWFGTNKGVNRYDGQWRSFPTSLIERDDSTGSEKIAHGAVTALAKAAHGDGIWLGTDNGAVAHWDGSKWRLVTALDAGVATMLDVEGYLWLGSAQGLYTYADGMLRAIADFNGDAIHAIVADAADGTLWIGSDSGLWRLGPGLAQPQKIPVAAVDATELDMQGISALSEADLGEAAVLAGPIQALWSDGEGSLWLGSGAKVVQFDPRLRGRAQL